MQVKKLEEPSLALSMNPLLNASLEGERRPETMGAILQLRVLNAKMQGFVGPRKNFLAGWL